MSNFHSTWFHNITYFLITLRIILLCILSRHEIFKIILISLMYQPSILFSNVFVIVHVSLPYNKIVSIVALNIRIFSFLFIVDFQICFSLWHAFQVIAFLTSKSLSELVIHVPRYLKLTTTLRIVLYAGLLV